MLIVLFSFKSGKVGNYSLGILVAIQYRMIFFTETQNGVFQLCASFWRLVCDIKKLLTVRFSCIYSHPLYLYKNNVCACDETVLCVFSR